MRVILCNNYEQMSRRAAVHIAALVETKPNSVLGLATGSTPVGLYRELSAACSRQEIDFSNVVTFNLDEYVGLPAANPNSYHAFMWEHLLKHINLPPGNSHIPRGANVNLEEECLRYEELIEKAGGIDLQILGIGHDGHIGFNEPSDHFPEKTHVETLTEETRSANARFFKDTISVPSRAITMGIGTIMKARAVLLLANGKNKASVIAEMLHGPITPRLPASVLRLHPNTLLFADKEAAEELYPNKYPPCPPSSARTGTP